VIVLRFEAENETALKRIQASFKALIAIASPSSILPY